MFVDFSHRQVRQVHSKVRSKAEYRREETESGES